MLAMPFPVASEDILGGSLGIPDYIVTTVLALAISHFPVNVSIIPFFFLNREFWGLGEGNKP
jgi:hypothetical protein